MKSSLVSHKTCLQRASCRSNVADVFRHVICHLPQACLAQRQQYKSRRPLALRFLS